MGDVLTELWQARAVTAAASPLVPLRVALVGSGAGSAAGTSSGRVLAGYMKKLGPRALARYDGRILNTHPALLPEFGGAGMFGDHVHEAVLASGRPVSGATVHVVTADYDEGPVVAQAEVPVLPGDDVPALRARVQAAEKALLVEVLRAWRS
ncbi:formyltransferase family protein [Isoptericola sp. NPDC019482]|uniref:formyltransferase family protein n=1 Tax=Isoptericola sp. NPDC019482 TaxID=3154688 RepID=UPI00347B192C